MVLWTTLEVDPILHIINNAVDKSVPQLRGKEPEVPMHSAAYNQPNP